MLPSLHFIPSHKEKYFKGLENMSSSALIFDLEDGVPQDSKDTARDYLIKYRGEIEGLNSFVRISKEAGVYKDSEIEIIKKIAFKGVVIPKVESVNEISLFLELVNDSGRDIMLIILIESFKGLEVLKKICEEFENKIVGVGLGLEDFLSAVPMVKIQKNITDFIKLNFISTAKAFNIQCIDTVSLNYNENKEAFREECIDSRNLLFDGRFSIHPTQISIINEVYSPSNDEIAWAHSIVEKVKGNENIGYQKAGRELISPPKVKKAQLILKKAGITNV
ncbi:MAG: aldolase/citrate lyase family protein [Balneola sp.]